MTFNLGQVAFPRYLSNIVDYIQAGFRILSPSVLPRSTDDVRSHKPRLSQFLTFSSRLTQSPPQYTESECNSTAVSILSPITRSANRCARDGGGGEGSKHTNPPLEISNRKAP